MKIRQLLEQGFSKTAVAKKLGISRPTLYAILKKAQRKWPTGLIRLKLGRKN
ncbi:helix-turn-helix domain-containing protein [Bacillus alveayuensis]|uniref:helix-turn-helix domain-containing protein n=1 Tax=Aeribacillus alveayuensis TaxID=279215 RepID=UPI001F19F95E|nr:helix-turn-helix domain-containing protein [Bacillus alveayuensis]